MKYLGVQPDKNLTFEAHVQCVLGKMANHVSVLLRLRHFCKSSIVVKYYNCDAMMHVLKDSINLKYSELLTKPISKCNLI